MTHLVNKRINLQIATQSWLYIYHIGQYQTLICIISFLFSNEKRICKTFHKVALGIGGLYVYWYQIILHVFPILQLQCWFSLKKKILSFFSKSLRLQFNMFQHFLLLPISIMFMTLISDHQKINQVKEQISVPLIKIWLWHKPCSSGWQTVVHWLVQGLFLRLNLIGSLSYSPSHLSPFSCPYK